jgi:predicted nucleotidyltransferase
VSRNDDFALSVSERLAALPGVVAVQLGGSRAQGTALPDSDWDFALYYRGAFEVDNVRKLGWSGYVSELGEWGQVMNGGAWLTIDSRPVDLHYRDLDVIDRLLSEAAAGRFEVHRTPFLIAGIPTYVLLAELALGRTLYGELPVPAFPDALRRSASAWWKREAELDLGYARTSALSRNAPINIGLLARVIVEEGHHRLCENSRWITNEKRLIMEAGLNSAASALVHSRSGDLALVGSIGELLGLRPFAVR